MALKRITTKEGEIYFVDANTGQRVGEEVNSKYVKTEMRFKHLLGIGQFVTVLGWIIFMAGIFAIIIGAISLKETSGPITIIGGIAGSINGILIVAIGQMTSCFVSIENNTYKTVTLLKSLQLEPSNKEVKQS